MSVQKVIAVLLLACLGILIPAAASPLRVCMLEKRVPSTEVHSDANCCSDCTRETDDREPCCMDLDALPDSSVPQPSLSLPTTIVIDLPVELLSPPPWIELGHGFLALTEPIRRSAPPAARRAVLGVWRL
jgi:hypothetical protein